MNSFIHPVIGQEIVTPNFGLGRVVSFKDNEVDKYIEVRPYETKYTIKFNPEEVKLVKIDYE